MSDMHFKIVLIILLIIAAGYIFHLRFKNFNLRRLLDDTLHKKAEIGNFLSIFSKNLKTVEEIEDSMNMTARYVADLVGASSLCIFTLEEDGFLKAAGIAGAFPPLHKSTEYVLTKPRFILESLRREKIKVGDGIIGEIAQNRESLLLEDAAEDPRIAATGAVIPIETLMAVPMVKEGKLIGVVCAVNNREDGKPFSPEQFSSLKFMAGQVELAYNIVKVYSTLSKQQRINQELEFAKQLQHSLLPKEFPEWGQFSVHAFSKSAKEVSGDFYDFVEIDKDRLLVIIGDACGKGIPACLLMFMARSFIRANIERYTTLNELMQDLNNNLYRDTSAERFITIACCVLNRKENTIEYVRAGHTELLIFVPSHHHSLRKIFTQGTALGLMPGDMVDEFETFTFSFQKDLSILLYTDGITEALNKNDEEFGMDRLRDNFMASCETRSSPQETIEKMLRSVDMFVEETPQSDDETLVVIKHRENFV
ncbi:MAG TPA: hypothetical protein DCZ94_14130 [Lentisphaeria bacterium]|nr:MAG: hypothetical protein A2X48_10135 [Lentisphaerae bacterium GWF2_49_21]HBC88084.1 hypothetical protein [Lentisphaeria bacterium]